VKALQRAARDVFRAAFYSRRIARPVLGCAAIVFAAAATAAPYVPVDDARVLERLPSGSTPQIRELRLLQGAVARPPTDLAQATALANAHVRASRVEGDPRFLGYAQAALAPWWKDPEAPTAVLMLRATILQSRHEFDASLADLGRVLQRDPRNAQALLTRATVLTVRGNYAAARDDCNRLSALHAGVYATACLGAIDSVTGNSGPAYATLSRALESAPRIDAAGRAWAETLLGEIAHRRGDPTAERHFRAALAANERDLYLLGAYCDWLLDQRRAADAMALIGDEPRVDALLLRLALAQHATGRPEAAASIETLRARFEASRARGDAVHQRENARFELVLRGDPRRALVLAQDNWKVQREPSDLLILAQAASAAGDASAIGVVKQWLAGTGFEFPAVAALVATDRGTVK
jgi:tetratricopeptide (TPR) repeat protein